MLKLSQFRDFLAVAEVGSLRAAARHLSIAQPVISRSIRELEHELGVPLFERHAKGVVLTPAGDMFVQRVRSFQNELRRGQEEIAQTFRGEGGGEVSIAMGIASCASLLPPALEPFYRRFPNALLKISEGFFQTTETALLRGEVDFWVGPLNLASASSQFHVERLFDNSRLIVGRKGHPLAEAGSLADLGDVKWVRPTVSSRSTEVDFDELFETNGLPRPTIAVHARSVLMAVVIVAATDFLTALPRQWLEIKAIGSPLQALHVREAIPTAPMCMVRRQGLPLTPAAEYLSDQIRKVAHNYARSLPPDLAP